MCLSMYFFSPKVYFPVTRPQHKYITKVVKTIVKFSEICLKQFIRTKYLLKYLFTT